MTFLRKLLLRLSPALWLLFNVWVSFQINDVMFTFAHIVLFIIGLCVLSDFLDK